MMPSAFLVSRVRPGKPTTKKARGFLALPGEVRNQIYGYYFEGGCRCEIVAKGAQFQQIKPKSVKLWAGNFQSKSQRLQYKPEANEEMPPTIRVSRPLGKYNIIQGLRTNWFTSLFAINLVCKQLHAETLPFLYQKMVFVFDAPNRIMNFLDVVSKTKLQYMTKLHLHYTTYGSPRLSKDRIWQHKHSQSWIRACSAASKKLTGLQSLKIWIRDLDCPLRFNLREAWVLPLLQFRRLTRAAPTAENGTLNRQVSTQHQVNLRTVDIEFCTGLSGTNFVDPQLQHASDDLHRLFGKAIELAILGAKEEVAMAGFNSAWQGEHAMWQYHLGYGKTGW